LTPRCSCGSSRIEKDGQAAVAAQADAADLDKLWTDLAGDDAMRRLRRRFAAGRRADQAVPFLKGRLQPVRHPDTKQVPALAPRPRKRYLCRATEATAGLQKLGELVESALRAALVPGSRWRSAGGSSGLLARIGEAPLAAAELQALRGLEALERIGSPEALKVIEHLATGATDARLTSDARAAADSACAAK